MARVVYVPELGRSLSFQDGATDQQISSYLKSKYSGIAAAPTPAPAPAPKEEGSSGPLGAFIYSAGAGLASIPEGIEGFFSTEEEIAKSQAGQKAQAAREALQYLTGYDPTKEPTTAEFLAGAAGSLVPTLAPGSLATKAVRLAGMAPKVATWAGLVASGAAGAGVGSAQRMETIRQQKAAGMSISPEEALASQRLSGLIGISDLLPVAKYLGPIADIFSKVPAAKAPILEKILQNRLAKIAGTGAYEGVQEVGQGILDDINEYGIYNPDVQIGQDVLSNAAGGAFAGSLLEGVVQVATGRKLAPYRQLQQDLATERMENSAALRQGRISQAAENLRQSGITGPLDVVPEEVDGLPRYLIKTPEGQSIAEFVTQDDAAKAIDLYKNSTGVDVMVREDIKAPEVFPVEIGNQKFNNIDEIKAARDKAVATRKGIEKHITDPALLNRNATERGVSEEYYTQAVQKRLNVEDAGIKKLNDFLALAEPKVKSAEPVVRKPKTTVPEASPKVAEALSAPAVVQEPTPAEEPVSEAPIEPEPQEIAAPEPVAEEPPIGTRGFPTSEIVAEEPAVAEAPVEEPAAVEVPKGIVEEVTPPENAVTTRPDATPEQLTDLQQELFGAPIGLHNMTPEQKATYEAERDKRFPPVPLDNMSAGQTTGVEPLRVTPRIGTAFGEVNLKPEVKAVQDRINSELNARLRDIAPPTTSLQTQQFIDHGEGYLVHGTHNDGVINIALGIYDPKLSVEDHIKKLMGVLNHETIHAVRNRIRPSEWKILSKAVENTKIPGKKYTYLDKAQAIYTPDLSPAYADPDAVIEEAVAEMYKDWYNKQQAPNNTRGLFNRITEILRRVFRVLKSSKYEDVFKSIESGQMRDRDIVSQANRGTIYSAGQTGERQTAGIISPIGVTVRPFPEGNPGSSTTYLRRDFDRLKTRNKGGEKEWGAALDRSFISKFGRPYDINNPSDYAHIVDSITDEIKHQMNEVQSGVGWYDSDIQDVFDELAKSFPILKDPQQGAPYRRLFTMIAGVMSNGMKAKANVELAAINFANFLNTGRFSANHPFTGKGWNQRSNIMGPQIDMLNSMVDDPRFAPRPGSNNPRVERIENFLDFMFSEHSVRDINKFRAEHGTKSPAKIGGVNDKRLGMYAFGPKFGPFILNLNGYSDETVDSWASRSFYRHMGRSIGPDGELVKAPLTSNREAMKRALRDVAANTGLSSRDIQAVLWFYEKELYNQLGQKIPLEVFSDGAREFTRKYGAGSEGLAESRTDREGAIARAIGEAGTRYDQTPERIEGRRVKFSAAPLPTYLEQQNQHIFAPVPNVSFKDMVFDFFGYGQNTVGKTLNTQRGTITISDKTMRNISRRMNVVDRNAYIAHLEKLANEQDNPGQFERMVADDSALAALVWRGRASHVNASMIIKGKLTLNYARPGDLLSATMKVEDDPDSLLNISKILLEPGPVGADGKQKDKREVFKMYATAKRAIGLKADGKPLPAGITDQYIRDTIPFVEQSYPEVAEAYRMYQRFNKNLLTTAVNAGIISQQELADLTKRMDYYGYYREAYQEDIVPTSSNKTASRFNLREYKGSQRGGLINDPLYVMLQNSHFWVDSIAKNIAATKSFNLLRRMDEARILQTGEKPNRDDGEEDQVMFFMDNGVLKRFAVKDPMLAVALGSDDRIDMGSMMKWLSMPTQILRESVTRDPGFMFANLARDTMSTWITSGESIIPFIDTVKGFKTALTNGASFQELMGRGVVGSYDLGMKDPKDLAATIARRAAPKNIHTITNPQGLVNVTQSLWDKMGSLSEASDAATRVAVYEAARAQGMSEAEASLRAIEIMDFSRHGSNQILSILTKLVPFLNARIQGIDVLYQAAKAGGKFIAGKQQSERDAQIGKRFLVRGGILAVISMALEMLNEDDEDYRGLEDYIKNSNVLIPLKHFGLKGEFIAIPKPFESGLIFSTFPQQFYKSMQGDATTRENIGLFTSSLASTFGVNPIPQLLLPAIEVMTNHDFYTGLPLIPEGKSRLSPELQYNASTSSLAMLIGKIPVMYNLTSGKFEGISPIVIDNLIGGYGGPLGTYIAQAVSIGMETASVGPERLPQDVTRLPIVRRFFIDAESKNPKVVSQAYELFGLADEANRSFSRLRQMGDVEATMAFVEENKDILSYKKYIFKLVDGLNKISARERAIERDGSMTRDEKFAAMKNLRDMKIQIATKVADINKVLGR